MIYLLDAGGQRVGPFKDRESVERFIELMALCGEDWADDKIVEGGGEDAPGQNSARMDSCADHLRAVAKLKLVTRKS